MISGPSEDDVRLVEKEILGACHAAYPQALRSWEADSLWSRVTEITRDDRPYALGGQKAFYLALGRLEKRGCIAVNRGGGGMFEAHITPEGIGELEAMKDG